MLTAFQHPFLALNKIAITKETNQNKLGAAFSPSPYYQQQQPSQQSHRMEILDFF